MKKIVILELCMYFALMIFIAILNGIGAVMPGLDGWRQISNLLLFLAGSIWIFYGIGTLLLYYGKDLFKQTWILTSIGFFCYGFGDSDIFGGYGMIVVREIAVFVLISFILLCATIGIGEFPPNILYLKCGFIAVYTVIWIIYGINAVCCHYGKDFYKEPMILVSIGCLVVSIALGIYSLGVSAGGSG